MAPPANDRLARRAEPATANPFAATSIAADGPRLRAGPNRYAGFWWRVLAHLIDLLVLAPVSAVTWANARLWHQRSIGLSLLLVFPLYKIGMDARGGTVGKRACGIIVIDSAGRYPGLGRALSRNWQVVIAKGADLMLLLFASGIVTDRHVRDLAYLPAILEAISPILLIRLFILIDALSIAGSARKRALHDRWAGTWCIRPRRAGVEGA